MAKDVNRRITGPAIDVVQQLDGDLQYDVYQFLQENPAKELYSKEDVVNAWLTWNGIIGFTPRIMRPVQQTFK